MKLTHEMGMAAENPALYVRETNEANLLIAIRRRAGVKANLGIGQQ